MKHLILKTWIFRLSLFAGLAFLLLQIFQWKIVDIVTPILMIFVQGPILLFFIIIFLWSALYPFWGFKKYRKWSFLPLSLNTVALLIVWLVPFTEMTIDTDFQRKLKERVNVVEKIKSGDLRNNVDYNKGLIHLPIGYPSLSEGGNDVIFEHTSTGKLNVLFFTYRGLVDNFAGIVYKEDNTSPTIDDFTCGTLLDSKKFQDNWFWMSCT